MSHLRMRKRRHCSSSSHHDVPPKIRINNPKFHQNPTKHHRLIKKDHTEKMKS